MSECKCNSINLAESDSARLILSGNAILDFPTQNEIVAPFPKEVRTILHKDLKGMDVQSASSIGVLAGTYRLYIGQYKIPELRGCWRHVVDERGCYYDVSLVVTYPTISDYAEAVRNCVTGCGVGTLLAAYLTGGSVLAAAKEAIIVCTRLCLITAIGEVANEFSFSLEDEKLRCSDWSNH
jgi:hypothetical protein